MKNIKKRLLLLTVLLIANLGAFSQTALEIIEKSTASIDISSMEMTATLKIYDAKGRERVRQTATATKAFDGIIKTIVKFTAPADVKGTSMLIYDYEKKDDDMWIYLPALRKTRRIVSSEKGKSFMGSEFSNADMSKPNIDNFSYLILGTENYEGKACWKIETTCNNQAVEDENGYSKKISWIEKESFLCHKIAFYDLDGELHKTQSIKDYRKQSSGKYFAFIMEKENVQNGRKSEMIVNQFQENSALPESAFAPAMLEK